MARRFNTLRKGDWGGLVEMWERDAQKVGTRREEREPREFTREEQLAKLRREVVAIMCDEGKV